MSVWTRERRCVSLGATSSSPRRAHNMLGAVDESQLSCAAGLGFALVTHDQWDFRRLHRRFERQGRAHAGIVLLPFGPLAQVEVRAAMVIHWLALQPDAPSRLIRWHDLQQRLQAGGRLADYDEAAVRLALGGGP
jgi:hypothetical protein